MPSAEHYLAEQTSSFTEHSSTDVVKAVLGRGHDGRLLASVVLPPYQDFEALCALNTACYESFSRRPGVRPGAAPAAEPMSLFRSQVVPKMSLMQLGVAMQRNTDCTDEQLLAAIVLCVRYCRRVNFDPTMHTMHRMFVTALHLIQKSTCDVYFQNAAYARLSGMALWEINRLEQEMISGLDWRVMVTITDIVEMLRCNKAYFADLEVTAIPSLGDSDASSADEADGHTRVTCATRRQRESAATFNEAVAH